VSLAGTGVGFAGGAPVGNMVANFDAMGNPALVYTGADGANLAALVDGASESFDFAAPRNFGIPGITLLAAANYPLGAYASPADDLDLRNPYARLYLNSASAAKSQVQLVAESGADFCTLWLGNNDVLGYVTAGGDSTATITPLGQFAASFQGTLAALAGVEHLLALNVPGVTDIPFVTYFRPVLAAMLESYGMDPVVMAMDDDLGMAVPVSLDPAAGNWILLPAASEMAADPTLGSPMNPLDDAYVLDAAEAETAAQAVADFNAAIAAAVDAANAGRTTPILLLDVNGFFSDVVAGGYDVQGEHFSTEFVSGGVFSLDGVHPSSLGYGMIANRVIEEMNDGWNLDVAPVDLSTIFGVTPGLGAPVGAAQLPDFSTVVELFN